MSKRHVKDCLSLYIDGQLAEKKKRKVQAHLTRCKDCSEELKRLRLLSRTLQTWQLPELSGDFDASLKDKILRWEIQGGKVKMKSKSLAFVLPSSALALLLMVAVLGQLYVKRGMQGKIIDASDEGKRQTFDSVISMSKNDKGYSESLYKPYYLADERMARSDSVHVYRKGSEEILAREGASRQAMGWENIYKPLGYAGLSSDTDQNARVWDQKITSEPLPAQVPAGPATLTNQPDVGPVIVIQPVIPATAEGEKVIRTGEITLEVENGQEAYHKAAQICQELGGYLGESGFYRDNEGRENGKVVMRIPKDKFLMAMDRLSALGKVSASNSNSQDVGREYKGLKQELDITMVVYHKMFEALSKKQVSVPEAIRMESELTPVLRKIENLKGRLEYLDNLVSYTTVTLNFYEPKVSSKALAESKLLIKRTMIESAINSVKFIAGTIPLALFLTTLMTLLFVLAVAIKKLIVYLLKRK